MEITDTADRDEVEVGTEEVTPEETPVLSVLADT
jgi:hypothetical protein